MKAFQLNTKNLDEAAAVAAEYLADGGVVMLPTDTAYGLAADATSQAAAERVFQLKGRDAGNFKSAVIVPDLPAAERIAVFNDTARKVWDAFMPGALTLVLPVAPESGLCEMVQGEDGTIGLRHPDYEFTSRLAERFGKPFTATSANLSGQPPAYRVEEFLDATEDAPHLVIDAGPLEIRPVSTVVSVADGVKVLREGAIPATDIERAAAA